MRRLLAAARTREPLADLAADDESLVADASDRLASVAAAEAIIAKLAPPVADQLRRLNVASTTDAAKRLAAVTQLACQPDQVGAFARRRARLDEALDEALHRRRYAAAALDDALKSLACQLLASGRARRGRREQCDERHAERICRRHGQQAALEASQALMALASKVAVPRDLRREAACAFQAHSRALAGRRIGGGVSSCLRRVAVQSNVMISSLV